MNKKLYFLSIHTPMGLEKDILKLKNEIKDRFQSEKALRLPGHITLFRPTWIEESLEEELVAKVAEFVHDQKPFQVELLDFGAFTPRTVYIRVIPNPALTQLKHKLDKVVEQIILPEEEQAKENKTFVPHITIANRDLKSNKFREAWDEFQHRNFEGSFKVMEVHLLKHNGKRWEVLKVFPLQS